MPAAQLVNGCTIVRVPATGPVAYFHIELATHDLVLAEGQPAETFVDRDSRGAFANAADYARRYPGASAFLPFCRPRVEDGSALARIRAAVEERGAVPAGTLSGYVDRVTEDGVEGWADATASPVLLEVLVNGAVVGTLLADRHRPDLAAMVGGYCAFFFTMLPHRRITAGCSVSVRRARDGVVLPRTTASLARDAHGLGRVGMAPETVSPA